MAVRYPVILVHGVAIKEFKKFRAFGRIGKVLREAGNLVYTSDTDGFGTVENNAGQLAEQIGRVLKETGLEKVNLIAHSKGGLDALCALQTPAVRERVASLTTLCTPHRGSAVASWLYRRPRPLMRFLAFWIDFWYRLFGDKHPDSYAVCRQLCASDDPLPDGPEGVYCQSFSATMNRCRDDFLMSVPLALSRYCKEQASDGLVSADSSRFAEYRGDCLDGSLSHTEVVGFSLRRKKRERVYAFYLSLVDDLAKRGY